MTAPTLERMKFWIIKPATGRNYLYKPTFAEPDGEKWWTVLGTSATLSSTSDEQRFGAYCMQVDIGSETWSAAKYAGISVTDGLYYTFSAYVKADAGHTISLTIRNAADAAVAIKSVTATGYWQRPEVTLLATETSSSYNVRVTHSNFSSDVTPMYVDGVQFEQTSVATTLMEGYMAGCRWEGIANDSTTYRTGESGLGGVLLDISDYARILSVHGLGMGDWNQIMTKMTSGGDMYQTHIRKSRNFSMVLAYTGDNQGDLQANRKVILGALRPDYMQGRTDEKRVIRYQGFDANGNAATNPIDIVCVFQPSHADTPSLPVFQKDVLNFTIPSGLLQGAYQEGAELDMYADFPAEFIVKRDADGNWCSGATSPYTSLITGLNDWVRCMAEAPDGNIYVGGDFTSAGGVSGADYLARWNINTETWEAVGGADFGHINPGVYCMKFDANGDLYIGGKFETADNMPNTQCIAKISNPSSASPTWSSLGTGLNFACYAIEIGTNGYVYAGGAFTSAGGVANTQHIARWNGSLWSSLLAGGLNDNVYSLAFSPNDYLYIGGAFTNVTYPYLMRYKIGHGVGVVGKNTDINGVVYAIAFNGSGKLLVGGTFTNAGGVAAADYLASWDGSWYAFGAGVNGTVSDIVVDNGLRESSSEETKGVENIYVSGTFTSAGGLPLADRIAIWSNGTWLPVDINLPGAGEVAAIVIARNDSLYLGGRFTTAGTVGTPNAITNKVTEVDTIIAGSSASANTYPFMQVHGPGTLKAITNYSTGKTIAFNGLTLLAGEHINLWFDPLNLKFVGGWSGRGNLMRYVVPGSDYGDFYLRPARNYFSMYMTESTSDTYAWITWTPQFWGLDGALL